MKSGTNWLGRILRQHPDVDCVGEFHWESFYRALAANANRINPQRKEHYQSVVRPNLESMVKQSLTEFAEPSAHWIGDRTPTTLDPIAISDAPHFVIVRDFRDVIVSRMFHLYSHPRVTTVFNSYSEMQNRLVKFQADPWYFNEHPDELVDNEEIVRTSAKEWSQFLDQDEQTIATHPSLQVLKIRYEQLHEDFSVTAKSIFDFLDLQMPVDFPADVTPGLDQESPTNLKRKGIIGDWKNYLNDECLAWIEEEAGTQLKKQGYA